MLRNKKKYFHIHVSGGLGDAKKYFICMFSAVFWFSYYRSILNGVTRILDINTDAGSTEMHKLEDTGDHTADGGTETTKKQTTTSEDSKPDKQRTVKIEKVRIFCIFLLPFNPLFLSFIVCSSLLLMFLGNILLDC